MKQSITKLKLTLLALIALFLLNSCVTANAPTRYQGRNLYKFHTKKRTQKAGKARAHKYIDINKRSSYNHPAVPDPVRKELRQRIWSDDVGAGQLYK